MKIFEFTLKERNGEYEYLHHFVANARNLKEAEKVIDRFVRSFYGDGIKDVKIYGQDYWFYGGEIIIEIDHVGETTKEKWCDEYFASRTVN